MLKANITEKHVNPNTGTIDLNVVFDAINGKGYLINAHTNEPIENSGIQYGYKGENKWRITSEIGSEKDDHSFCFNCKYQRFKHILAIDTNIGRYRSQVIDEELEIGLAFGIALLEKDDSIELIPLRLPFITELNPVKPEQQNWIRLIELLKGNCKCSDTRKIGIVVDCDLDNIPKYNSRELPILGNYYLPEGFELIFASDKVSDNIFNQMIKDSHKLSRIWLPKLIQHIQNSEIRALEVELKK